MGSCRELPGTYLKRVQGIEFLDLGIRSSEANLIARINIFGFNVPCLVNIARGHRPENLYEAS